jgi:cobalt-zinc-cadmium resistance protein CzcA
VFARTGTAEIASDPMPPNISDGYIMLKPAERGPTRRSRASCWRAIRSAAELPGNNYEFSQPIQLRFNELISGVRSDVAVKVFGDDMDVLNQTGEQIAAVLQKVPGASEVKVEQTTGLPMLTVRSTARSRALRPERAGRAGHAGHRRRRPRGRHAVRGRPPLRHRGAPARELRSDLEASSACRSRCPRRRRRQRRAAAPSSR